MVPSPDAVSSIEEPSAGVKTHFLACTSGAEGRSGSGCLTLGDPDDRVGRPGSASTHEHGRRPPARAHPRRRKAWPGSWKSGSRSGRWAASPGFSTTRRPRRDIVWNALPLGGDVWHAKYAMNEIYCLVPPIQGDAPGLENSTTTPIPGDIVYFYFPRGHLARSLREERGLEHLPGVVDLAVFYGRNNFLFNPATGFVPGNVYATSWRTSSRSPEPRMTSGAAAAWANVSRIAAWKAVADRQTRPVSGSHHRAPAHRVAARPVYRVHYGGGDGRVANAGCDRRIVGSDAFHP